MREDIAEISRALFAWMKPTEAEDGAQSPPSVATEAAAESEEEAERHLTSEDLVDSRSKVILWLEQLRLEYDDDQAHWVQALASRETSVKSDLRELCSEITRFFVSKAEEREAEAKAEARPADPPAPQTATTYSCSRPGTVGTTTVGFPATEHSAYSVISGYSPSRSSSFVLLEC